MEKIRIYELAKKLGKESKEIVKALEGLGVKGKKPASTIDGDAAGKVLAFFKKGKPPAEKKAPAKPAKPVKKDVPKKAAKPEAKKAERINRAGRAEPGEKPAQKRPKTEKPKAQKARPQRSAPPKAADKKQKPAAVKEVPKNARPALAPKQQKPGRKPGPHAKKRLGGPPGGKKKPRRAGLGAVMGDMLPEDVNAMKVPDRFQKETEGEKMEKFKGKPGMQKAFQAIRKIDPSKRRMQQTGGPKRKGRGGGRFHRQAQPERPKLPSTTDTVN
ncbi:MAG TPA: hypothetical protein ENI12_02960, partial [Nitrospirae bacterium]|nr:hypothetical protein [Nitrospirota bacterium]